MSMRVARLVVSTLFVLSFVASGQAPTGAPAGSTGQCRDGSYSSAASKRGACSGHKGVQTWFVADTTPPAAASKPAASPMAQPAAAPAAAASSKSTMPASGGGNGQVWVNTASNVYHCSTDRYYGKTKQGAYMSEADAKAKGARPDHGRSCS